MSVHTYEGKAPLVHQVTAVTVGGTIGGETFTISAEHPSGSPGVVVVIASHTDSDTLAASAATALAAAWNASNHPFAYWVSALAAAGVVTFTADRPGVPFILTLNTPGGSATFVQSTTTAASGPNIYNITGNWREGDVPGSDDDVIIPIGAPDILYGLAQGSVTIDSFTVQDHRMRIGCRGAPLKLGVTDRFLFDAKYSGECHIHLGTANLSYASPVRVRAGYRGLWLTGGNVADDWTFECGKVYLAAGEGETGTCNIIMNEGADIEIGYGFTFVSHRQSSGRCRNGTGVNYTDAHISGGIFDNAAIAQATNIFNNGGHIIGNNIAGVSGVWYSRAGINDLSRYLISNTIAELQAYGDSQVIMPAPVAADGTALQVITVFKDFRVATRSSGSGYKGFDTGFGG